MNNDLMELVEKFLLDQRQPLDLIQLSNNLGISNLKLQLVLHEGPFLNIGEYWIHERPLLELIEKEFNSGNFVAGEIKTKLLQLYKDIDLKDSIDVIDNFITDRVSKAYLKDFNLTDDSEVRLKEYPNNDVSGCDSSTQKRIHEWLVKNKGTATVGKLSIELNIPYSLVNSTLVSGGLFYQCGLNLWTSKEWLGNQIRDYLESNGNWVDFKKCENYLRKVIKRKAIGIGRLRELFSELDFVEIKKNRVKIKTQSSEPEDETLTNLQQNLYKKNSVDKPLQVNESLIDDRHISVDKVNPSKTLSNTENNGMFQDNWAIDKRINEYLLERNGTAAIVQISTKLNIPYSLVNARLNSGDLFYKCGMKLWASKEWVLSQVRKYLAENDGWVDFQTVKTYLGKVIKRKSINVERVKKLLIETEFVEFENDRVRLNQSQSGNAFKLLLRNQTDKHHSIFNQFNGSPESRDNEIYDNNMMIEERIHETLLKLNGVATVVQISTQLNIPYSIINIRLNSGDWFYKCGVDLWASKDWIIQRVRIYMQNINDWVKLFSIKNNLEKITKTKHMNSEKLRNLLTESDHFELKNDSARLKQVDNMQNLIMQIHKKLPLYNYSECEDSFGIRTTIIPDKIQRNTLENKVTGKESSRIHQNNKVEVKDNVKEIIYRYLFDKNKPVSIDEIILDLNINYSSVTKNLLSCHLVYKFSPNYWSTKEWVVKQVISYLQGQNTWVDFYRIENHIRKVVKRKAIGSARLRELINDMDYLEISKNSFKLKDTYLKCIQNTINASLDFEEKTTDLIQFDSSNSNQDVEGKIHEFLLKRNKIFTVDQISSELKLSCLLVQNTMLFSTKFYMFSKSSWASKEWVTQQVCDYLKSINGWVSFAKIEKHIRKTVKRKSIGSTRLKELLNEISVIESNNNSFKFDSTHTKKLKILSSDVLDIERLLFKILYDKDNITNVDEFLEITNLSLNETVKVLSSSNLFYRFSKLNWGLNLWVLKHVARHFDLNGSKSTLIEIESYLRKVFKRNAINRSSLRELLKLQQDWLKEVPYGYIVTDTPDFSDYSLTEPFKHENSFECLFGDIRELPDINLRQIIINYLNKTNKPFTIKSFLEDYSNFQSHKEITEDHLNFVLNNSDIFKNVLKDQWALKEWSNWDGYSGDLKNDFEGLLESLAQKERQILINRTGIYGPKLTLEEIGSRMGVSRERVRQLEKKVRNKVIHSRKFYLIMKQYLSELMEIMENKNEKLVLNHELEYLFTDQSKFKDINVLGFLDLVQNIKLNGILIEENYVTVFSKEQINRVNQFLDEISIQIRDEYYSLDKIVHRFFEKNHNDELRTDPFVTKLFLRLIYLNKGLTVEANVIFNSGARNNIIGKIKKLFREIQEPMHFSKVHSEIESIYGNRNLIAVGTLHNILGEYDCFTRTDLGIYALGEWGMQEDKGVRELSYEVLKSNGSPMHYSWICIEVKKRKNCSDSSIYAYLGSASKITSLGDGLFCLDDFKHLQFMNTLKFPYSCIKSQFRDNSILIYPNPDHIDNNIIKIPIKCNGLFPELNYNKAIRIKLKNRTTELIYCSKFDCLFIDKQWWKDNNLPIGTKLEIKEIAEFKYEFIF